MKTWMLTAVMCLVLCSTAHGAGWGGTPYGADDLAGVRAWYKFDKVKIGLDAAWIDGLDEGATEGWRGGFFGTYDVVQDANVAVLNVSVKSTVYVGVLGGVVFPDDDDDSEESGDQADATASMFTGLRFGGDEAAIGLEVHYLLNEDLWQELAAVEGPLRVVAFAEFYLK